jgi:hypothetical protein
MSILGCDYLHCYGDCGTAGLIPELRLARVSESRRLVSHSLRKVARVGCRSNQIGQNGPQLASIGREQSD